MVSARGSSRTNQGQSVLEIINLSGTENDGAGHQTSQKVGTPKKEVHLAEAEPAPKPEPDPEISIVEAHISSNINTRGRANTSIGAQARISAKATKKKKDELTQENLRESVQQLMNLAKYEIEVDVYRGIYDKNEETRNTFAACSKIFVDDSSPRPLLACSRISNAEMSSNMKRNVDIPSIDDNNDRIANIDNGQENRSEIVADMIQCPCVKSWLRDEIDKQEAAALRAKKAKRRRSIGKKQKAKTKKQKMTGHNAINADEGEIQILDGERDENGVDEIPQDAATKKNSSSASGEDGGSGNNKQLLPQIRRNSKSGFVCSCDFNPFCIVSMGGIVDDYLNEMIRERCKKEYVIRRTLGKTGSNAHNGVTDMDIDTKKSIRANNPSHANTSEIVSIDEKIEETARAEKGEFDDDDDFVAMDKDTDATARHTRKVDKTQYQETVVNADVSIMEIDAVHTTAFSKENSPAQSGHGYVVGELLRQEREVLELDMCTSIDIDLNLRTSIGVDAQQISNYLTSMGLSDGESDKSLSVIQHWHQDIVYDWNPKYRQRDNVRRNGSLALCQPVGMRNLGATCYLNSQLQCLVANLAFIQGVFRWTGDEDQGPAQSNQMTLVISRMQTLLARMVYGPQKVVCTDEFSSALCLENNEMQDPNEFARLLFDRMHESFQTNSATPGDGHGLKDLLPRIFSGRFEYTTKCLECSMVSTREEKFMDLNLPIQSAEEVSTSLKEVTVEYLFERYLKPEKMDGANKYQCNNCNKTCEAERAVAIAQCPPVLNIQLARYIFDVKTFRKQKLLNKILLPRTLVMNNKTSSKDIQYILCGVQNHRGSSAYSGHYVAEVMDWTTGIWFEYDDEKVSVLDHPTSSYDPSHTAKTRLQGGTTDAYNLFYVEKSFLNQKIKDQIELLSDLPSKGVIQEISLERQKAYTLQKDIQSQKEKDLLRLNNRRSGILRHMFQQDSKSIAAGTDAKVWVEGELLRRFFSCTDPMDDVFENGGGAILKHKRLLCKHKKGLHPRVARTGKLLSMSQYKAYMKLLQSEHKVYTENKGDEAPHRCTAEICDLRICTEQNLYCKECATEYRTELKKKVDTFGLVAKLYDCLDPANENLACGSSEDLFAVSKSFITNFRKFAMKKMKLVMSTKGCSTSENSATLVDGIDHFDLSGILSIGSSSETEVEVIATSNDKDHIDPFVNSKITCKHGGCNVMNNKRLVRFVPCSTWGDICILFPGAICHPVVRLENGILNCIECQEEKGKSSDLSAQLSSWAASKPKTNSVDNMNGESPRINQLLQREKYRLVPSANISVWRKAIEVVKRSCKRKTSAANTEKLKNQLVGLFATCKSKNKKSNPSSVACNLQRLTCPEHNKALLSLDVVQDLHAGTSLGAAAKWLSAPIEIPISLMNEQEFFFYSSSLGQLDKILFSTETEGLETLLHHSSPQLELTRRSNHICQEVKDLDDIVVARSSMLKDGGKVEFVHPPCGDENCNSEFLKNIQETLSAKKTLGNGKSLSSKQKTKTNGDRYIFQINEFSSSIDRQTSQNMLEKQRNEGTHVKETAVRRSSRNRGHSSPNVFTVECSKSDNLAQLRLLVYQKSSDKVLSNHMLSIFHFDEATKEGTMMELLGNWNERKLDEILSSLPFKVADDPPITVVLNTQVSNVKRGDSGDKKEQDESLFDLLVHMATSPSKGEISPPKNGRRRRREERGFAGTFLQSSFQDLTPATNGSSLKPSTLEDKVATAIDLTGSPSSKKAIPPNNCDGVMTNGNKKANDSSDNEGCREILIEQDLPTEDNAMVICTENGKEGAVDNTVVHMTNPMISMIAALYEVAEEEWFNLSPLQSLPDNDQVSAKCPDVPPICESITDDYSIDTIKHILERGKSPNSDEREALKQQLQFTPAARNLCRNFMDFPLNLFDEKTNGSDLPISQREADIILCAIEKKDNPLNSAYCQRLIPYRSSRSIKHVYKQLQETNIVNDSRYKEYMKHVVTYVERIDQLEEICGDGSGL